MAYNQLKTGAVLNYIILGLNAITGLVYTPFMLRMMGQSEYGIYALASSVIAYLSILDFGFGNAIIRYTAKYRADGKLNEQYSLFGLFTILYSLIGLICLVAGVIVVCNVDLIFGTTMSIIELKRTKIVLMLMVLNLGFSFPLSIWGGIITAYEEFVFLRVLQIFRIILSTIVMIALLYVGYKAIAMVVVSTIFNFFILGLNYIYAKNRISVKVSFKNLDWSLLKSISIYSFWIFLNIIMDRIYWSTGQFVLGAVSGTAAVAVFAVAITFVGIYMSYSTAISGVFLPRLTAIVCKPDCEKEVSDTFIRIGRIQFIPMSLILSGFIVFGHQFIMFWAGKEYEETFYITLLLFCVLFIPLIQNIGITVLQARNQMKFRSIVYFINAVASLLFQIPLAKFYGGIGCAIAISVALIIGQI
ncbi:MAG: oligosaccharide flippase family protein, partial [Bacteroidales bacterium]|nr:oligosaccharide flippase family protein [Candidatus Sodaliphilus fimicaballi]